MSPTISRQALWQKTQKGKEARKRLYERNMDALREYKDTNPCKICGTCFDHTLMRFVDRTPSISYLAGSRCNLKTLRRAMASTTLLCQTCYLKRGKEDI